MIKNILDSYIEVINNINEFENNIKNFEYIPVNERNIFINEFNTGVNKEGCDKLYHEEFSRIAEKLSERNAIVFNDIKIMYNELDENE